MASGIALPIQKSQESIDQGLLQKDSQKRVFAREVCEALFQCSLCPSDLDLIPIDTLHDQVKKLHSERTIDEVEIGVQYALQKKWVQSYKKEKGFPDYEVSIPLKFMYACKQGDCNLVEVLIEEGVDVNCLLEMPDRSDQYLSCPLVEALCGESKYRREVVKMLENASAKLHVDKDVKGNNFIHREAMFSKKSNAIVYYLRHHESVFQSLMERNSSGKKPIDVARDFGNKSVVDLLVNEELRIRGDEMGARKICRYMLQINTSQSISDLKGALKSIKNVEESVSYAAREKFWLVSVGAPFSAGKAEARRYTITPGLKLMLACRNGDVDLIKERIDGNHDFWLFTMNMHDDPSNNESCPLQESLEAKHDKREQVIKIMAEAGAQFSKINNAQKKHEFLLRQVDRDNISAFESCLEYFDNEGESLEYHEGGLALEQYIQKREGKDEFLKLIREHRFRVSQQQAVQETTQFGALEVEPAVSEKQQSDESSESSCSSSGQEDDGESLTVKRVAKETEIIADFDFEGDQEKILLLSKSQPEEIMGSLGEEIGGEEIRLMQALGIKHHKAPAPIKDVSLISEYEKENLGWVDLLLNNDFEGFKALLKGKSYTVFIDKNGDTPMHHVCRSSFYMQFNRTLFPVRMDLATKFAGMLRVARKYIHLLYECGFNLFSKNNAGDTPLHLAVQAKTLDIVKFIILFTNDKNLLNITNNDDLTPLMMAVDNKCDLIALELMDKGADVERVLELDFQGVKFFSHMLKVYGRDKLIDDDFAKKLKVRMRECKGKS